MDGMLDLDITLVIQLVNFIITLVVLNYLLIKPVRDQINARNALTAGYAAEIEKFTSEAADKISSYEAALSNARTKASVVRDAIKADGTAAEQKLLSDATSQAQEFLASSKAQISQESQQAKDSLVSQVNTYASKAVAKILG